MSDYKGKDCNNRMTGYLKEFGQTEHIESDLTSLFSSLGQTLEKKSLLSGTFNLCSVS